MSMTDRVEREAVAAFTHAGLECALLNSGIGFINGYVRLPESHFAHALGYNQINRAVVVHGGLTYGADADGWVGFDTGHGGDYWPGLTKPSLMFGLPERTWDVERLRDETEALAEQLADLTDLPMPSAPYEASDDEFRVIVRQAKAWRRLRAAKAVTR